MSLEPATAPEAEPSGGTPAEQAQAKTLEAELASVRSAEAAEPKAITDPTTFADFAFSIGRKNASYAAALRAKLRIPKSDVSSKLFSQAFLAKQLAKLKGTS